MVDDRLSDRRLRDEAFQSGGQEEPTLPLGMRSEKRAVAYLRVSTEEQVEGHSLDAQRRATRLFARRRGWTLTDEYVDAGHSAKQGARRPALDRLLEDAGRGLFDVVVVDKVDRFYRHLRGLLGALDTLNEADVSFVSVRENIDLSTPWGKLTLTVLGMLAEIYIDNLRQETRKGLLQRARKGLHNGSIPIGHCDGLCSDCNDPNGEGYCPLYGGPDRGEGEIPVSHPVESKAVRLAFDWYLTGRCSDGEIAERLNAHEMTLDDGRVVRFRTKGVPGRYPPGRFSKSSVRHLLQHPFYAGVIPYYGRDEDGKRRKRDAYDRLFPGQHEGLITMEEFEEAQRIRKQAAHRARSAAGGPCVHPLSGLLVCGKCGERMRASTSSNDYRYYRDVGQIEHRRECDQPTLPAEEIEGQVVEWLQSVSQCLPEDWEERVAEAVIPAEEREDLERRERELKARIERATRLHLEGHISYERFAEEKHRAQAGLADLRPARMEATIAAKEAVEDIAHRWEAMGRAKQNGLLRKAIAEAQVEGSKLTAVRPTLPLYPLVGIFCRSGADGT